MYINDHQLSTLTCRRADKTEQHGGEDGTCCVDWGRFPGQCYVRGCTEAGLVNRR